MARFKMPKRRTYQHQISSRIEVKSFKRFAVPDGGTPVSVLVPDEFDHLKFGDFRKFLVGCLFTLFIASANAALYNIIRRTVFQTFDAPAFVIWFRCFFRIFVFPIYLVIRSVGGIIFRERIGRPNIVQIIRDSSKIYGDKQMTFGRFLLDVSCLTVLSIASQWLNYAPLYAVVGAGDMAALATCSLSFVFILCVVFLKIDLMSVKMFGSVVNLSGVFVLTILEIVANPRWRQSLLILAGTFFTAAYQVTFKVRLGGTTDLARISYIVSLLALFMAVFMLPLIFALKYSGIETWEFNDLPWSYLLMTSSAVLVMVFVINLGVSRINPFFTSMGFLLTCPATFVVEVILTPRNIHFVEFAGASVAVFGAVLLVFADVSTWKTVKTEWTNLVGNIKWMHYRTEKSLTAKMEVSTIEINDTAGHHNPLQTIRSYSIDPALAVPEWSQTGSFKYLNGDNAN